MNKKRKIFSWVVGILLFGLLNFIFDKIALNIGLSTSFYFEGFEHDQYVEKDKSTPLGWFFIAIEINVVSRVGMAIYYGNFNQGIGKHTNLLLTTLIACLGAYALIDTIIWEFFEREVRRYFAPIVYNILQLILVTSIAYIGFVSYYYAKNKRESQQLEDILFEKINSNDGDHFLEKREGVFFLGYDNGKDLRMWRFELPNSISEQALTENFFRKTGRGVGRFEFFNWLEMEGINLNEHDWY